jgi:hypothetical protein
LERVARSIATSPKHKKHHFPHSGPFYTASSWTEQVRWPSSHLITLFKVTIVGAVRGKKVAWHQLSRHPLHYITPTSLPINPDNPTNRLELKDPNLYSDAAVRLIVQHLNDSQSKIAKEPFTWVGMDLWEKPPVLSCDTPGASSSQSKTPSKRKARKRMSASTTNPVASSSKTKATDFDLRMETDSENETANSSSFEEIDIDVVSRGDDNEPLGQTSEDTDVKDRGHITIPYGSVIISHPRWFGERWEPLPKAAEVCYH